MHPSCLKVQEALQERGVRAEIIEFAESTRTAQEAAAAIGTNVAQIVKSLLFAAAGHPVLALVSGANRLDVNKLAALAGDPVERPSAQFVKELTGFAIGGVPPVGHPTPLVTFMDQDLLRWDVVYAAAGTPSTIFAIDPRKLQLITGATVADLASEG